MDNFLHIISLIIVIGLVILSFNKMCKEYKESKTIDEKVLFWLSVLIAAIPVIIFYLDYFDVASLFKWINSNNVDRWFNFISTYCSTIMGAVIGAIALVLMTVKQINLQREKDIEDRRIQNMPLLIYDISEKRTENYNEVFLYNTNSNRIYNLYICISNAGLNHARNVSYSIYENKKEIYKSILNFNQSIIKKDESIGIDLIFNYTYDKSNKTNEKMINIILFYEDLLGNKYSQEVNLCLEITNKSSLEYGGYAFYINNINIEKEKLIRY